MRRRMAVGAWRMARSRAISRGGTAVTMLLFAAFAVAQDRDWVRQWESAQAARPATVASTARIAPASEPGIPLAIHGTIVKADGVTPAAGVVVFAYQTDQGGEYNRANAPGWRLRGWAKSDARGRFEFRTIRPGSYPGSSIAAHIHLTIDGGGVSRRWTNEINFDDDRFVTASMRQKSEQEKPFGAVRQVTTRDGVQHVDVRIRIDEKGMF